MTLLFLLIAFQSLSTASLVEQFKQTGYVEICNTPHAKTTFSTLYSYFDDLIEFLQNNPGWEKKLFSARERFLRTKDRNFYSSDFFGYYDESKKEGRKQIAFYYSIHFHEFICSNYPECNQVPEITHFFEACLALQQPCERIFDEAAAELGIDTIFSSKYGHPPVLIKVLKYFPDYIASKPHYDGTAFSLFLDSTDNSSLLFSPYKSEFMVADFSSALRKHPNSLLLIPGAMLTEFFINPTPHIVIQSNKTRYATIAFAMRPNFKAQKTAFAPLPNFQD